jgi:hypothetical protein
MESAATTLAEFLNEYPDMLEDYQQFDRTWHAPHSKTLGLAQFVPYRTSRTLLQHQDRHSIRQRADTWSRFVLGKPIQDVTGRSCSAWISTIFSKTRLRKGEVRLRNWNFTRFLGNAVPERLQITDLLCL